MTASRNSSRPRFAGYWCVPGSVTASRSASTTSDGVGVSGSPMPSEITSIPCAFFSRILRSSSANRYGGMRSRRLLGLIQLLYELVAERCGVHALRPASQGHVQVLAHLHLEVAAVEVHRHGARPALQHVSHGGSARTGPGRERLPHAPLEYARCD